jgi:hypothetical protein
MMKRLMHAPHIVRRQSGRHRFNAFALAGQQQSFAIQLQRIDPVCMPCGLRQAIHICRKAFFLGAWRRRLGSHKTILHQLVPL